ncbi:proteasome-type protease [uncultured Cocleimonas sp.]|uniref:proteasome-type protease n=1 Tax=uncultured Cocleimonas sp. TaxID=1051587 RepID=UPI00261B4DBA|nr:proteasome-type protease [uncultured Cocleimonas sp.]
MTYCIAIKTNNRLVFASDSRTNAGPDHVSTYSKMFKWGVPGERQFILVSAGNLATTQAVVETIERDMKESAADNLLNFKYISSAADYIGRISLEAQNKNANLGMRAGFNAESTFILGGQIGSEPANIYMIYPQGNHITCPETTPFLQIGEIKYGKPLLDRVITDKTSERDAVRAAMVSMDSTMRSNSTVGPPIEIESYHINSLQPGKYKIFEATDPYLQLLSSSWAEKLLEAFLKLPELPDFPDDGQAVTMSKAKLQSQMQSQMQTQSQDHQSQSQSQTQLDSQTQPQTELK